MSSASYQSALAVAKALSSDEQLRLIQELSATGASTDQTGKTSILEICGLGAGIWSEVDAQEYVNSERSSWGR